MSNPIPIGGYGQRWHVRIARKLRNSWGHCDYDKREIVLSKESQEKGIDREVLIHEVLHKVMPFLTEECIDLAAVEVNESLEACGY